MKAGATEAVPDEVAHDTPSQRRKRWADGVTFICFASMLLSIAVRMHFQLPSPAVPVVAPATLLLADMPSPSSSGVRFPNFGPDEKRRRQVELL